VENDKVIHIEILFINSVFTMYKEGTN